MEIKVLGTVAPYPKGTMNCPGFLVSDGEHKVMLDIGPGSTRLLDMYKDLKDLTVFISHFHPDHYSDIFALANASYVLHKFGYLENEVKVYHPNQTEIRKYSSYCSQSGGKIDDYNYISQMKHANYLNFDTFSEGKKVKAGDMEITFFKTIHELNGHAIKIDSPEGKIVYSGDMGYDPRFADFARNADILICEATFLRGQPKTDTHLYAYEAGKLADLACAKNLYLFHTYPEIPKEKYKEEALEEFPRTHILEEGQVLKLEKGSETK